MAEVRAELTANIQDLEAKLKKAEQLQRGYGDTVERQSTKASKGFRNVGKGAANALPATQEFSRVIQDAPFGIQGVGNNLQQLTANFGNLSRAAGGTVPALKAMLSSLAGPAGILLAVSAVTSLLTVYSDELFKSTSATEGISKATGEFIGKAESEINILNNLLSISRNENESKKVRLAALSDINDKYSQYLGNLDLENVRTKEVQASVDALTKSLIKQAQVRGIESAISEIYGDAGEELTELLLRQRAAAKAIRSEVAELTQIDAFSRIDITRPLTEQIKQIEDIVNRNQGAGAGLLAGLGISVAEFNNAAAATREFKNDLQGELAPLQELLNDFTVDSFFNQLEEIGDGFTGTPEKLEKFKNTFQNLDDVFGVKGAIQRSLDVGEGVFQAFEIKIDQFGNSIAGALNNTASKVKPQLDVISKALIDFNEDANNIVQNGITNTFAGIGEAIGTSIAQGTNVLESLGKGLLSSLGGVLVQLGTLAIETGVGILAVQLALKSLNPYVAIAAGVALVALGSAFSSGVSSLGSSGSSGAGSSRVAGQGSSGSNSFSGGSFNSGSFGGGRVVFEISGQKLIGVLQNTRDTNLRLGGNVSIG